MTAGTYTNLVESYLLFFRKSGILICISLLVAGLKGWLGAGEGFWPAFWLPPAEYPWFGLYLGAVYPWPPPAGLSPWVEYPWDAGLLV